MADAVASVSLRADMRDLTKALTGATGLTEGAVQKMTIALEKGYKRAEAAARANTKAINEAAAAQTVQARATEEAADAWGAAAVLQAAAVNKSIDAANREADAWAAARAEEVAALNLLIATQEDAARAAASAAAIQASASGKLADIAAAHGTAEEKLTHAYIKQKAEIQSLAAASGNAAAAEKAMIAVEKQHATSLANLRGQHTVVTAAVNTTKGSYGNLFNQLADVSKGLAGGMSPLTILTQQGEQLVFAIHQAVPAAGVLTAAIGAIAVPAAALAGTFALVAAAVLDYADANAEAKRQSDALSAALTPLKDAIAEQQAQHALLNAAMESDTPSKYLAIARLSAEADAKEADATKALREEKETLMQSLADSNDMENFAGQMAQNRIAEIDNEIGLVHQQANEYALLAVENYTLTEAISGMEKAGRKRNKAEQDFRGELDGSIQFMDAAHEAYLKLIADENELDKFRQGRYERERLFAAKAKDLQDQADTDYYNGQVARTKQLEQGEKDRLDIQRAYTEAGASVVGSVGDALALAQDNMTGLTKKQAMLMFRLTQAAQIAQVAILAPAAILQGLAQAGPAGGIAAGIAAGVQVAAIAAAKPPSFRQGTAGYSPVGEQPITANVGPGEGIAVVSRQGMAGARSEGVSARNAGLSGGGGVTVVNMVLDGTILGTWIAAGAKTTKGKRAIKGAMSSSFRNPYRSAP